MIGDVIRRVGASTGAGSQRSAFNVILGFLVYLPPLGTAGSDSAKLITASRAPVPRAALIALIETRILISKQFVLMPVDSRRPVVGRETAS